MTRIAIVLAAALCLASCGGGGASTPSPFRGVFDGTWSDTSGDVGTADMTISTSGHMSGPVVDTTNSTSGTFSGTIKSDGSLSGAFKRSGHPDVDATGTWTLSVDGQTLGGTLTSTNGTGTYTLTRQ